MMTRYYEFSGVKIAFSMPESLFFEEEFRLTTFRTEPLEPDWTFHFEKSAELLPPRGTLVSRDASSLIYAGPGFCIRYLDAYGDNWKIASARVESEDGQVSVQLRSDRFAEKLNAKYALTCLGAEHLVARNQGFVLHCSFIEWGEEAILFTAPCGTGKSTQAELWNRYRGAEIINGDRAAIRLAGDVLLAEGIPFAGSSDYCQNKSLPIRAIVYLSQAKENTIRKLRGFEAFSKIWEGVTANAWDREDMERVSEVVERAAKEIPVYHMACTPEESAVIALEETLRKQVKQ